MNTHMLRIRAADRDTFLAIKNDPKKVETRAATERYWKIQTGDFLIFICGKEKCKRRIQRIYRFRSIGALLRRYRPAAINPTIESESALRRFYYGFPGYREKIEKSGLLAFELKK